eukprot:Sspe_Gene.6462::Locus_2175_Transcript_1_1_Confidence_1.000_Length_1478::g.6462::m.6462
MNSGTERRDWVVRVEEGAERGSVVPPLLPQDLSDLATLLDELKLHPPELLLKRCDLFILFIRKELLLLLGLLQRLRMLRLQHPHQLLELRSQLLLALLELELHLRVVGAHREPELRHPTFCRRLPACLGLPRALGVGCHPLMHLLVVGHQMEDLCLVPADLFEEVCALLACLLPLPLHLVPEDVHLDFLLPGLLVQGIDLVRQLSVEEPLVVQTLLQDARFGFLPRQALLENSEALHEDGDLPEDPLDVGDDHPLLANALLELVVDYLVDVIVDLLEYFRLDDQVEGYFFSVDGRFRSLPVSRAVEDVVQLRGILPPFREGLEEGVGELLLAHGLEELEEVALHVVLGSVEVGEEVGVESLTVP